MLATDLELDLISSSMQTPLRNHLEKYFLLMEEKIAKSSLPTGWQYQPIPRLGFEVSRKEPVQKGKVRRKDVAILDGVSRAWWAAPSDSPKK